VRTNSKWKPVIEISVSVIVRPPVHVMPEMVRLIQRQRGANPTGFLIVVNGDGVDADLVEVRSDVANLEFQWKDLGRGRRQVVAELKTEGADEEVSGTITIETTHPDVKTIEVPVTYAPIRRR
jgi:hypothetical protein